MFDSSIYDFIRRSFSAITRLTTLDSLSRKRVAIIISSHKKMWAVAAAQRIISSIRSSMGHDLSPEIDILSAQNSKEALYSELFPLLDQEKKESYSCVVTVGNWVSKEVRDHCDTYWPELPQVFCGVDDPTALGLVDSLRRTGRCVTGITSITRDYRRHVGMLLAIKPSTESVLIPYYTYDNDPGMLETVNSYVKSLITTLQEHDVMVTTLPINDPETAIAEIMNYIKRVDSVITLVDRATLANMDELIAVCNKYHKTLCTSDLSSVFQGAALGCGEHGTLYGSYVSSIICDIMLHKRDPRDIPVIKLQQGPDMCFNRDVLVQQGIMVTQQMMHLLQMRTIFTD